MKCPYCSKIITMCAPLTTFLASGTHNVFCECCKKPITISTKSIYKIDYVEKGEHKTESFHSRRIK